MFRPLRPLRGLQETRVATREESGVLVPTQGFLNPASSTLGGGFFTTEPPGESSKATQYLFTLFTFMHWRRKWQPTPVFLPGESQGGRSLVGCCLWGRTELDTTEVWDPDPLRPALSLAAKQVLGNAALGALFA